MTDLTGKVAVVMGASGERSFGSTIARLLAEKGAQVAVAARREGPLQALAEEIGGVAVACDITEDAQLEALTGRVLDTYGKIDIAVNAAGMLAWGPIAKLREKDILPTVKTSFVGSLLFFKHMGNAMAAGGGGSVMTISSQTAQLPGAGQCVYSAARAGIDYAVKIAAHEYGPQGVRFNSIAAGLIETDMTEVVFQNRELIEEFIRKTPLRRMGSLEDVARAALWLADGSASGFVTGEVISVAGGGQNGTLPGS